MSDPVKCYAVSSGEYSDYQVHAIYRRREDAEARVKNNNEAPTWFLDGKPVGDEVFSVKPPGWEQVRRNPGREEQDELRVEEFDYYEGEPTPAPVEGDT